MVAKNVLWALTLLVIATPPALAQSTTRFGGKAGLGVSKFTGDITGTQFGFGFGAGPSLSVDGEVFSFAADLLLFRRNYANQGVGTKTWEISIPLQGRYYIDPLFFVQAGLAASFGVGSYTQDNNGLASHSVSYSASTLSRFDFGVLAGAGAEFPLDDSGSSGALQLEARLNWGLKDRNSLAIQSVRTLGIDVLAGYLF